MLRPLLTALFATASAASALSGPSETRLPRAAETDAIIRAVCSSRADLGRLKGCKPQVYEGNSASALLSPQFGGILTGVLNGSFTAPNQQEALATFCIESESCSGETVLLRKTRGQWAAVALVPNFVPFDCLTYPRKNGTQAAVCQGESVKGEGFGLALRVFSWAAGQPKVETVARFPYLAYADPKSAQCAGAWEYQPFSWEDYDRNADRVPDLTVLASLDTYAPKAELCGAGMAFDAQPKSGVRRDLTFVWTGITLKPTGQTAATLKKYAAGN